MKQTFFYLLGLLFVFCATAYAEIDLEEGVNQLQNGDFEAGVVDPWTVEESAPDATGVIEIDKTEAHSGDFSLKMTPTEVDGTDWHLKLKQDNMSFVGGENHTIRFWAKAEKFRVVVVALQMNHDPWDGYLWNDVNLTTDWQEYIVTITPPVDSDREHWLAFHCGQSIDPWWIDDVEYYRGGRAQKPPKVDLEKGVNQLLNWDFEMGVTAPWEVEDRAPDAAGIMEIDKNEKYSGDFSLKMTPTAIDGTDWHLKVRQNSLSFEGGERHAIKFWAKSESPRTLVVALQMNQDPWETYLAESVNLTEKWQEFVLQVNPQLDNSQGHWLAFHCGESMGAWWVDDVRYYRGGPDDEVTPEVGPGRAVDPTGKATTTWGELKDEP